MEALAAEIARMVLNGAMRDSVALDAFAPRRDDVLRDDDGYLPGPQK
jgi:hypothetical protein